MRFTISEVNQSYSPPCQGGVRGGQCLDLNLPQPLLAKEGRLILRLPPMPSQRCEGLPYWNLVARHILVTRKIQQRVAIYSVIFLLGLATTTFSQQIELQSNPPQKPTSKSSSNVEGQASDRQKRKELAKKLNSIILQHIDFVDAPIKDVIHFLMEESKKADPAKEGITINYKPSIPVVDFKVTFKVTVPISLKAAIENITSFAQPTPLRYRIDPYGIIIGQDVTDNTISSRKIFVPSGIIKPPATSVEAKKFLEESLGIKFGEGTGVIYSSEGGFMVVTHTNTVLDLIEETLAKLQ